MACAVFLDLVVEKRCRFSPRRIPQGLFCVFTRVRFTRTFKHSGCPYPESIAVAGEQCSKLPYKPKNDIDDPCAKLAQSLRDQWELVQGHILNNSLRDLAIARGVHLVLAETVRQPCTKKSQKSTLTKGSTEQTGPEFNPIFFNKQNTQRTRQPCHPSWFSLAWSLA